MHVRTPQYEISAKNHFSQLKLNPPEHNLPTREKTHWEMQHFGQGKSCVLPTNPLSTCEIDYIPVYPHD